MIAVPGGCGEYDVCHKRSAKIIYCLFPKVGVLPSIQGLPRLMCYCAMVQLQAENVQLILSLILNVNWQLE